MASTPFDSALLDAGSRLEDVRQLAMHLDALQGHPQSATLARHGRAWSYVSIAAALEQFVREFIDEMSRQLNVAQVPGLALRPGIVALAQAGRFASAASTTKQRLWDTRIDILAAAFDSQPVELVVGQRPVDGRTIKAEHLRTIWSTYGFPGDPLPSPLHALALKDLSEGRNEVAHGNSDPVRFGRTKTLYDIARRVDQVEDIAIHISGTGASYLAQRGYLR